MTHRRASPLLGLVSLLVVAALVLSGCGGSSKKAATKAASPASVMTAAKKKFDDASSVHIALSTKSTPSAGNGVLGATGDITHDPAFAGDVKVVLGGLTATVPITSTGGKVYAKLPLQTKYSVIKPSEYGAPDPADFADPDKGLSSLLTEIDGLKKGASKRDGDKILTSYTGTLPGKAVKAIIPSADTGSTYATEVGVDDSGHAVKVAITGPFFADSKDVTYDVTFSQYGKGVKISTPSS
jgi:lipoprotein LprG